MKNAGNTRDFREADEGPADIELMRLIAAGQREAFATIVRRYQRPIVNLFLRLGADVHGAEDCAQETFLRLFRFRDRYRPTAPFAAFLYTLARHAWVDWSRREARRACARIEDLMITEEASGAIDARLDLEEALARLPEHLRWVIILNVDHGLSHAEIGAVLAIPTGTVKSRMFHAVRRLKEALDARSAR